MSAAENRQPDSTDPETDRVVSSDITSTGDDKVMGETVDVDAAESVGESERSLTDRERRRRLIFELDRLIARVRALSPGYRPPPFSPRRLLRLIERNVHRFSPGLRLGILKRLRGALDEDLLDLDTWRGVWYMVNYSLEYQGGLLKRRISGDYETDEWGLDWEFLEVVGPFLQFLYNVYWRVQVTGLEHVSADGPALLVGNHQGHSPWEGAMLTSAIFYEHEAGRLVRSLYPAWFSTIPFFSSMFVKIGHAVGAVDNAAGLLAQAELVAVYPDAYQTAPTAAHLPANGWSDFVRVALAAQAPLIPVAIIGTEETYRAIGQKSLTTRLTGRPHFLFSPESPWFAVLGFFPLPTTWTIDFGPPLDLPEVSQGEPVDEETVAWLADQLRQTIAEMVEMRRESLQLLPR